MNSVSANFGIGKVFYQYAEGNKEEDKDRALAHFEKVIQINHKHYKSLTHIGMINLERQDFDKAANYLKEALIVNPNYNLALVTMGNLMFEN